LLDQASEEPCLRARHITWRDERKASRRLERPRALRERASQLGDKGRGTRTTRRDREDAGGVVGLDDRRQRRVDIERLGRDRHLGERAEPRRLRNDVRRQYDDTRLG